MASSFYIIISITDLVAKIVFHNLCVMKKGRAICSTVRKHQENFKLLHYKMATKGLINNFVFTS